MKAPFSAKHVSRAFAALIALLALFAGTLSSCGQNDASQTATETTPTATAKPTATPPEKTEEVASGAPQDDATGSDTSEKPNPSNNAEPDNSHNNADSNSPSDDSAVQTGFPITISHAFGETTIPDKPERIVSVAWANHEVPLALGVVPVGMPKVTWGDDNDDGLMPWVAEQLQTLGADTPALFDETDGIDLEAVSNAEPDVILASYSGISEEEYQALSEIAPVVAYPNEAWSATYSEMIAMNSQAIGMAKEGQELISKLENTIADEVAKYPGLTDQNAIFIWFDGNDLSQIGFYTTTDTRGKFLETIGFGVPEVVVNESTDSDSFWAQVSAEQADLFQDVDIIVTYGNQELISAVTADPLLSLIPAIANKRIVTLEDSTPLAASANPSPLSIPWGISTYVQLLAQASEIESIAGEQYEPTPEEQAAMEAWAVAFDSNIGFEEKKAHIEDAEALETTITKYKISGQTMGGISLEPTLASIDGTTATITYNVLFGGAAAYSDLTGEIHLVEDTWVVSRDEFCSFMAQARNACPAS